MSVVAETTATSDLWAQAARKRRRFSMVTDPCVAVGGALFALVVLVSVLAPLLAPYSPTAFDFSQTLKGPTWGHFFGTDDFGRDVLSRTLYAGRPTLLIATTTVIICDTIGVSLGLLAGYVGGVVEASIMRVADILMSLPPLVLAIGIVGVLA